MLWRSTIQTENLEKPEGFSPETQEAQVGDAIFWVNEDANVEHQPCPSLDAPTTWCKSPLQGPEPSNQVNLATAGTIDYLCAIHPWETAKIVVANPVQIGRQASGTVSFVPQTVDISVGQSVSWANSDWEPHQPAPLSGPSTAWFAEPIPSGEVSGPITFGIAEEVLYRCVVPGHDETGTISVT
ncbi:MAG: hypothetical protein ABI779_19445 [Acidobacteriota bacterium]